MICDFLRVFLEGQGNLVCSCAQPARGIEHSGSCAKTIFWLFVFGFFFWTFFFPGLFRTFTAQEPQNIFCQVSSDFNEYCFTSHNLGGIVKANPVCSLLNFIFLVSVFRAC